jgi:hypothetical protein
VKYQMCTCKHKQERLKAGSHRGSGCKRERKLNEIQDAKERLRAAREKSESVKSELAP